MAAKNTSPSAPVLIRTYKKEAELEVWKLARDGRYVHIKTFPICRWSGQLGPKQTQGDRQAPEGFYPIARRQMNPNSHYYLSFDTGFPNAYDKAHGASGAYLMVHGTCSSAGCYAMTDKQIGEIYAIAREAFAGGQQAFQFQAFPFRMTAQNMAKYRADKNIDFWRQLKEGSDRFEATGEEPVVSVVDGRYTFARSHNAEREKAAQAFHAAEEQKIAALSDGSAALRISYSDGGQHPAFAALLKQGANLDDVSRPEALAFAGQEVVVIPARKKNMVIAALKAPPAAAVPEPSGRDICIALPIRSIG
ncbi:MAG: murein L,D-transpeptidase, partial [Methylobacteriaceae bacterium]|nr:murein L,D-transpeptidase [Methylobacteriaceae bacterium]